MILSLTEINTEELENYTIMLKIFSLTQVTTT